MKKCKKIIDGFADHVIICMTWFVFFTLQYIIKNYSVMFQYCKKDGVHKWNTSCKKNEKKVQILYIMLKSKEVYNIVQEKEAVIRRYKFSCHKLILSMAEFVMTVMTRRYGEDTV